MTGTKKRMKKQTSGRNRGGNAPFFLKGVMYGKLF